MKVSIEFCKQWNYHPQAAGLAAELKSAYGESTEVSFVESGGGVFEITIDGVLAFSKKQEKRFPGYREIPKWIEARKQGK